MATPINPHSRNLGKSFLRIPTDAFLPEDIKFPINQSSHNKTRLIPTRKIFTAKGLTNAGDIYFTRLKLAAKKILVLRTAICAFVAEVRSIGFISETKSKVIRPVQCFLKRKIFLGHTKNNLFSRKIIGKIFLFTLTRRGNQYAFLFQFYYIHNCTITTSAYYKRCFIHFIIQWFWIKVIMETNSIRGWYYTFLIWQTSYYGCRSVVMSNFIYYYFFQ